MKLYSGPVSPFSAKVQIALDEKQVPHERIDVPYSIGAASIREAYAPTDAVVAAVNPRKQVPVLVDGDLALYDSTVIVEYLEDKFPRIRLYPSAPTERARCRQLELYADEILFPDVLVLIEDAFYGGEPDAGQRRRIQEAHEKITAHAVFVTEHMKKPGFLFDDFGAADIALGIQFTAAFAMGAPFPQHIEAFGAWYGAVASHPSFAKDTARIEAYVTAHRGA